MYVSLAVMPFLGIFGLIYIFLSWRVTRLRFQLQTSLGDGGHSELQRDIRIHGNFAEYVPFTLLMLTVLDLTNHSPWLIRALGILLLLGRLMYIRGMLSTEGASMGRSVGVSLTWLVIAIASVLCLLASIR